MNENYVKIKKQFDEVITYSQGINKPKTDDIFERWEKNKERFIKLFGGKLIYEFPGPVHFSLSEEDKNKAIDEFVGILSENYLGTQSLVDFILRHRGDFFSNILSEDDGEIKKGIKLIKAYKYFIKNDYTLRRIQDKASEYIQMDKVSGKFCLSVHPLDYLSMSTNNYNWRSCMSIDDGDYMAGTLSYMVDPATVITYIKGDNEERIPMFPFEWNSKKWRMLLSFSDNLDMVFASRQYPYHSNEALAYIYQHFLKEKLSRKFGRGWRNEWSAWTNFAIDRKTTMEQGATVILTDGRTYTTHDMGQLDYKYISIYGYLNNIRDIVIDAEDSLHFNDLILSRFAQPFYCVNTEKVEPEGELPQVHIGGKVRCLDCGKRLITLGEGSMICSECAEEDDDDYITCDYCDGRILDDDYYELENGDKLCKACAENETFVCEDCGERYYNADLKYDEKTDEYICRNCFSDRYSED